jgi:CDGSH-type Zn-finger protein
MADVEIKPTSDGPYEVTGPVELQDPEGNVIRAPGQTIFLCRCGRSQNKPFCDSWTTRTPPTCARQDAEWAGRASHSKIGFQGDFAG